MSTNIISNVKIVYVSPICVVPCLRRVHIRGPKMIAHTHRPTNDDKKII